MLKKNITYFKFKKEKITYFIIIIVLAIFYNYTFLFSDNLGIFDWTKELFFITYLKQSLVEYKMWPLAFYFLPGAISWFPTLATTASFIGNPEVLFFSPTLIFLPFVSASLYIRINLFIHIIIGGWGIYKIGKYFNFDNLSIIVLFCLIILNPWMMQHLAIGYTPWMTFYYVPFIIFSLISNYKLNNLIISSIFTFFIIYEGGMHVFNWLNMAVVTSAVLYCLIFRNIKKIYQIGIYYLMSAILMFPKLFINANSFKDYSATVGSSYNSFNNIIGILTDLKSPLYDLPKSYSIHGVGLYDGSLGMGKYFIIILIISLLIFIYLYLKKQNRKQLKVISIFYFTIISFLILGWNGVWNFAADKIPILAVEKYPYRFLFISLILFLFVIIYEINCFSTKIKYLLLIFTFPLLLNMYSRNAYFNNIAASKTLQNFSVVVDYETFTLRKYYNEVIYYIEDNIIKKPDYISPQKIEINNINSLEITIPWLRNTNDYIFGSTNDFSLNQQDGILTVNFAKAGNNNLKIIVKDYNFKINLLLSLATYILLLKIFTRKKVVYFFEKQL